MARTPLPSTVFGMPTLAAFKNLDQNIALCKQLGLGFIELNMCLPQFSSANLKKLALRKIAESQDVSFTVHLPEELDFGLFNDELRDGSIALVESIAKVHGGETLKLLNMHINRGSYISLPDRKLLIYDEHRAAYEKRFLEALAYLSPLLSGSGILLCIENTGNFGDAATQHLIRAALRCPMIGVTWDFGHDAASGYAEKSFLLSLQRKVLHSHLHDFGGKDHQELFTGSLDIAEALAYIHDAAIDVVIETKDPSSLESSIRRLKEKDLYH